MKEIDLGPIPNHCTCPNGDFRHCHGQTQSLELQIDDLKKQVDDWRRNLMEEVKDRKEKERLNGDMRELLERFARGSAKCTHGFEPGSKHIVPDDCVFLVCQAATLLKLGYLKRDATEKRKCGLSKPLGNGETCVRDFGHSEPCEHQKRDVPIPPCAACHGPFPGHEPGCPFSYDQPE